MIKKFILEGFVALFAIFLIYYVLGKLNLAFDNLFLMLLPRFGVGLEIFHFTGNAAFDGIIKTFFNIFLLLFMAFTAGLFMNIFKKIGLGVLGRYLINSFCKRLFGKEENNVGKPALVELFGLYTPALIMGIKTAKNGIKTATLHVYANEPYHGIFWLFYAVIFEKDRTEVLLKKVIPLDITRPEFMSIITSAGLTHQEKIAELLARALWENVDR